MNLTEQQLEEIAKNVAKNIAFANNQDFNEEIWEEMKQDVEYTALILPMIRFIIDSYEEIKSTTAV